MPMSEQHPNLIGKKILNTRAEKQAGVTTAEILKRGGVPLHLACLEMECLHKNIRQSIPLLQDNTAEVLFTSRNGVACVADLFGNDFSNIFKPHKITAIGNKTATTLKQLGVSPEMIPEAASQEGLIDAYQHADIPKKLIFFRAEEGNDALSHALTSQGCEVSTIHAYRMKSPESDASIIIKQMQRHEVDAVLLGSPKTVQNYIQRIGNIEIANIPAVATISHQVATAAKKAGLSVQATAKTASFDAMLDALADYFNKSGA